MMKVISIQILELDITVVFNRGCRYLSSVEAAKKKPFSCSTEMGSPSSARLCLSFSLFTAFKSCYLSAALLRSLPFCSAIRVRARVRARARASV